MKGDGKGMERIRGKVELSTRILMTLGKIGTHASE